MFLKGTLENIESLRALVDKSCRSVKSNIEGKSTSVEGKQYDLFDKVDTTLKPVIEIYRAMLFHKLKKQIRPLSAWTVVGKEGCYHTVHRHNEEPVNHLSTVLYLRTAKNTETDEKDCRGYFYYFERSDDDIDCISVKPEEGDLFVFPVRLFHGSYPQAKGLRQTLNVDFEVID